MARFYQTARPDFVEDIMYQPPWKLMQEVLATKQKQYDTDVATAELFSNLSFKHLNYGDDPTIAKEKVEYYNSVADKLTNIVKTNGDNPGKYLPEIRKYQRELRDDLTTGVLSRLEGSYNSAQQWEKDNEQMKKDNPSRYEAARNYYYKNWGGNSAKNLWQGQQVTKDLDYTELRKSIGELKASSVKSSRTTPAGNLYMVERGGKTEELTEKELNLWLGSQILTPQNLASLAQSQSFELGTYTDSEGKLDYENGSLFAPLRGFAKAGAYNNSESELKYSTDSAAVSRMNEAGTESRFQRSQAWEKQKLQIEAQSAKDLAYQIKIAELMADGEYDKAAELSKLYDQSRGGTGSTTSKTGSRYSDFNVLAAKAKTDPAAKKLIEQTLPTALKQAGINFNDPEQAKIAKEITDKVILGTLDPKDIGDYIEKKIPVNKQINPSQNSRIEQIAKRDYNEKIAPIKKDINNIQSKIQEQKNLIASYNNSKAYAQPGQEGNKQKVIAKANQTIQQLQGQLKTANNKLQGVTMSTSMQKAKGIVLNSSPDLNATKRKDLVNVFEQGFKNATETFAEKRNFNTYYETSPSDAVASSRILNMFADPNFKKEFTVEIVDKNGKSTWKDMDEVGGNIEFTAYEGLAKTGPLGTPMAVLKGSDGKIYNVTANGNTPQMTHLINTAVNGMTNPSSQIAYQELAIPEASKIINTMQALKLKGINSGNVPVEFKNFRTNKKYNYMLQYDSNGMVNIIDPMESTSPLFSNPVSPLEAGKYINTILNK